MKGMITIVIPEYGKRIRQRPHGKRVDPCTRCGCRRARDADLTDPLCTPCRRSAPICPVCDGRGTLGRDAKQTCYRCKGTGRRPVPKIERRYPR